MNIKAKREELGKQLEQYKMQIVAIQGYLRALDDIEKSDTPIAAKVEAAEVQPQPVLKVLPTLTKTPIRPSKAKVE